MTWFNVDRAGLAAVLERRGKFFALAELISNAWDSGSKRVTIALEPIAGQPYAKLAVEDWGEGFADLSHAFTMFARSARADKADKRGRFNLGEKLVLACCRSATIETTSGSIDFDKNGERRNRAAERMYGTLFTAEIRMTRDEYEAACDSMRRLIPPVETTFNGRDLPRPDSLVAFVAKLPTEIADSDGMLRRSVALAHVEIFELAGDGRGELLEMGIPVVETENGFRVNVLQKIPLNMDRDNVTPAFLRAINAAVLNNLCDQLTPEAAAAPWAQEAAGDARATPEAVKAVIAKRFGERAVIATPGDPIANANAAAAGFTVIPGGALGGDLWANIRKHSLLTPAGQAFPTPKPEDLAKMNAGKTACPLCGK